MSKRVIALLAISCFGLGAAVAGWRLRPATILMHDESLAMRDLKIVRWDFTDVSSAPKSFVFVVDGQEDVLVDITAPERISAVYLQRYPFPSTELMLLAFRFADGTVSMTEVGNPFAPGPVANPRIETTRGEYVVLASKRGDGDTFFAFREYDPERSLQSTFRVPGQASAVFTHSSGIRQRGSFSVSRPCD